MNLENGKTYLVNHSRKGRFIMRVDSQCDTWVNGVVVGGHAKAILDCNIKSKGEPITSRISFIISAVEQP